MKNKIIELIQEHKATLEGKNVQELKGMMLEEAHNQQKYQDNNDIVSMLEGMVKLAAIGGLLD